MSLFYISKSFCSVNNKCPDVCGTLTSLRTREEGFFSVGDDSDMVDQDGVMISRLHHSVDICVGFYLDNHSLTESLISSSVIVTGEQTWGNWLTHSLTPWVNVQKCV